MQKAPSTANARKPNLALGSKTMTHLKEKQAAKEVFLSSDTFKRMLESIVTNPKPVVIDADDMAYFPEREKKEAHWEFASLKDIRQFWAVIADPEAATVEPRSLVWHEKSIFSSCSFKHFGLYVGMLFGLGTCVYVSNRPPPAELATP